MIPLIFKRLTVHVPRHCFTYNEFLELVKAICIQNDAKEFVQEQGIEVLDAIYTAKKDLPLEFQDDQRIFYRILSLDHETFTNIKRYLPSLLSTLQKHFHQTLTQISGLSTELCQALFAF